MKNSIYEILEPGYYTEENIRKRTDDLLKTTLKNIPIEYVLKFCSADFTEYANVEIKNGMRGDISIVKKDLGLAGSMPSCKLSDLEPSLRLKAVELYMTNAFVHGNDFIYDRLRINDNIQDGKKLSGSVNIKGMKEVLPKNKVKASGIFKGKVVLDSGEETGNEYNINKSPDYSDEFDNSMIIRCLDNKIAGPRVIHVPYSTFRQVLDNIATKYKAFIYYIVFPAENKPEFESYTKDIEKVKRKCARTRNYSKFYSMKKEVFGEFIKSIILSQHEV